MTFWLNSTLKSLKMQMLMKSENSRLNRRDFLKSVAAGSAASSILSSCGTILNVGGNLQSRPTTPVEPVVSHIKSTVAAVTHTRAVRSETQIDAVVVQGMLEEGIKALAGKSNLEECWLEIFPQLKSSDVIGIKIVAGSKFSSPPELVNAITNSLLKIGVRDNNIIVWDRLDKGWGEGLIKCGYKMNSSDRGVRYMSTNLDGVGYDKSVAVPISSAKTDFPVSRIVSQLCDYLISVPILKGGRGCFGVTGSMKNYYGAIPLGDRPNPIKIQKMHRNSANPQIPELFAHPLIRDKNKLCINDALLGRFSGGPAGPPQFINNQLIIGTDPVAVDYQALMIIERERARRGLSSLLAYPKYIQSAAEMGLGTNNPDQIDLREVNLS